MSASRFEQVVGAFRRGEAPGAIADRTGVPTGLVRAMVAEATRLELRSLPVASCGAACAAAGAACSGCPLATARE